MDLSTLYLGLKLKNPLLVGAGPLTSTVDGVRQCAAAGAGAVVLKSLFEEELQRATEGVRQAMFDQATSHAEVYEYLEANVEMQHASRDYLQLIKECKAAVAIPVIASVNCSSPQFWSEFSAQVQVAGADALELNIAIYPDDPGRSAAEIEDEYVDTIKLARQAVSLPLAVKLGPFFTNLPNLLRRLAAAGADGFVLFNRFYPPSVDLDQMAVVAGSKLSTPLDLAGPLRAVGLCEGRVPGDFAANSGIHDGADLVKVLLAGATVAQVVTTLLKNRREQLGVMLAFLEGWMQQHNYATIGEFQGRLAQVRNPEANFFSRRQYTALYGRQ